MTVLSIIIIKNGESCIYPIQCGSRQICLDTLDNIVYSLVVGKSFCIQKQIHTIKNVNADNPLGIYYLGNNTYLNFLLQDLVEYKF